MESANTLPHYLENLNSWLYKIKSWGLNIVIRNLSVNQRQHLHRFPCQSFHDVPLEGKKEKRIVRLLVVLKEMLMTVGLLTSTNIIILVRHLIDICQKWSKMLICFNKVMILGLICISLDVTLFDIILLPTVLQVSYVHATLNKQPM